MRAWMLSGAVAVAALWWAISRPSFAAPAPIVTPSMVSVPAPAVASGGLTKAPERQAVGDIDPALPAPTPSIGRPVATEDDEHADPLLLRDVRVVDAAGRPVAAAMVAPDSILRADGGEHHSVPPARTDGDGRARVEVRTGQLITVYAPGFRLTSDWVPSPAGEWVIVVSRALRLEVLVVGAAADCALSLRVLLPSDCGAKHFHQDRYEQTPGRATEGTVARWEAELQRTADGGESWRSFWTVALSASGTAVLDQIEAAGEVTVQLRRFSTLLEERRLEFAADQEPLRLQFFVAPTPLIQGVVATADGTPLPNARLRMAPYGDHRAVDCPDCRRPFPLWAPETRTDDRGRFGLPRPDDLGERVVVTCDGRAARAVTVAEIMASGGRIELAPASTVRIEIRDCNGAPLDGGWSTAGRQYMAPSVLIGHDVWRGTDDRELPWFEFAELPPGEVTFRCAGEVLRHDARVPYARLITAGPVDEMGIGK